MLIVEIKKGENIEKVLKTLKSKVIKTKQNQFLTNRKDYKKPSVVKRTQILNAIYNEKNKKIR
jgi:small subunit ribosomal protein S21